MVHCVLQRFCQVTRFMAGVFPGWEQHAAINTFAPAAIHAVIGLFIEISLIRRLLTLMEFKVYSVKGCLCL